MGGQQGSSPFLGAAVAVATALGELDQHENRAEEGEGGGLGIQVGAQLPGGDQPLEQLRVELQRSSAKRCSEKVSLKR